MASGQRVVEIITEMPTAANGAEPSVMLGTSTPGEIIPVHLFDDTTTEYLDLLCRLSEEYDGGGLTFTTPYAAVATSGNAGWSIGIRRIQLDAEDLDTTAQTYDYNDSGADTVPSASGEIQTVDTTFTDGADMDFWASGEFGIVRIKRNVSVASDATGDLKLIAGELIGKET